MYKVQVISLKRREDRRAHMAHMFQHINFDFVDALDGQTYKLTKFDKEFIKGNDYKKHGIHIPSLVCANYTHLNLLDECSKQDQPYFIFEDDVEMTEAKAPDLYFEALASVEDLDAFLNSPVDLAYSLLDSGIDAMKIWPFDFAAEKSKGQYISAEDMKIALSPFNKIRKDN